MKLNCKFVTWGIFAALLLSTSYSNALTLGRIRGTALLGKPLDVSVLVQYAPGEEVGADCFAADVHYGEAAVERSRITLTSLPGSQPNTQVVRVLASGGVDEALVRLTLRSVCGLKTQRSYTILSDVVSELAGGAATAGGGLGAAAAPMGQTVTAAAVGSPAKPIATPAVKKPAAPAPAKRPAKAAPAGLAKPSLSVLAIEDLQRRVDEIDRLQAANASSAAALQASLARASALETDIQGLRLVTAKNQQNIETLAAALESSSSDPYGRSVAYTLAALLLAGIAALAYVGMRRRYAGVDAAPWWTGDGMRPQGAAPVPTPAPRPATAPAPAPAPATMPAHAPIAAFEAAPGAAGDAERAAAAAAALAASRRKAVAAQAAAEAASVGMVVESVAASADAGHGAMVSPARPDFVNSAQATLRSINTREMLDVRQQAEFFMALGQHDEAVRLLESNIQGNAESNPLVYLDLLKILHTLSRRVDFERVRTDFNALFTGRIPAYADFLVEGNGLEGYEDICNQIVVLWPTEYTSDYLEQCMVRLPADDPEQGMDMEAFKDLLLLYGVLKRLDQSYDSSRAPFSASRHDNPVNTSFNTVARSEITVPIPVSHVAYEAPAAKNSMDLDLDLDMNLDLDLTEQADKPVEPNNLIDFDISPYVADKKTD